MSKTSGDDKTHKPRAWLERLTAFIVREPQNQEQLIEIVREAEDRDVLSAEMLGMIERILHVSQMQVREVMISKSQMITVNQLISLDAIFAIAMQSGHSRFPVYDTDEKEIIGILLAKDLLKYYLHQNNKPFNIADIIRPATFVPQSKRLDILLSEFRVNRNHIAIVLDEYGHVAGLITIEDVLEQIVGDIEDEHDIDEEDGHIKKLDDGSYIIKACTPIQEFNKHFKTTLNDEEFDTLGGVIIQAFGHLPKRGESAKILNFRFKVLQCDNRRIYLLEMKAPKTAKLDP